MIDPTERWAQHGEKPDYAGFLSYGGAAMTQDPAQLEGFDVAVVGAPMDDLVSHPPRPRFAPPALPPASCPPGPPPEAGGRGLPPPPGPPPRPARRARTSRRASMPSPRCGSPTSATRR